MYKIIIILILIPLLTLTFFEGRKAYWDYRVTEMCEKDGGIKVKNVFIANLATYESLKNNFGQLDIPKKGSERGAGVALVRTNKDTFINDSKPKVRKSVTSIIRAADNAAIATKTSYSRVGGDLIALHPSYFSCPKNDKDFYSLVVVKEDLKK